MKPRRLQLITYDPKRLAGEQLARPCSDCPWARASLAGWLGPADPDEWLIAAHADARVDCHVYSDSQCAGLAIYRANVAKIPRGDALRLPADRDLCFASPAEFLAHHANPSTIHPSRPSNLVRANKRRRKP